MENVIEWNAKQELTEIFILRVTYAKEMKWRYEIANLLLLLASKIAKFTLEVIVK